MAEYKKVKRVIFPLDEETLLLVSMDAKSNHNKTINAILKTISKFKKENPVF